MAEIRQRNKFNFDSKKYDKLTIYTDGGCLSNPSGIGGIGVVVLYNREVVYRLSKSYRSTTNNRMELLAPIEILKLIPKEINLTIISDSLIFVNGAKGTWQRKANLDLWTEFDNLRRGRNINYQWIKGHNGDTYNEMCDSLCTNAMNNVKPIEDEGYVNNNGNNGVKCTNQSYYNPKQMTFNFNTQNNAYSNTVTMRLPLKKDGNKSNKPLKNDNKQKVVLIKKSNAKPLNSKPHLSNKNLKGSVLSKNGKLIKKK